MSQAPSQRPRRAVAQSNATRTVAASGSQGVSINHEDNVIDFVHYLLGGVAQPLSKETEARTTLDIDKSEFPPVTVDAAKRIEETLGCKLLTSDAKMFMQNELKQPTNVRIEDPQEEANDGFLFVVLTLLFMLKNPNLSSSRVTKRMLWEALEEFGLDEDTTDPSLGDLKELIAPRPSAEFVAKGWVSYHKLKDEADEHYFEWGPRAIANVDAVDLLKQYLTIMGEEDIDACLEGDWKSYMNRARRMRKDMKDIQAASEKKYSNLG